MASRQDDKAACRQGLFSATPARTGKFSISCSEKGARSQTTEVRPLPTPRKFGGSLAPSSLGWLSRSLISSTDAPVDVTDPCAGLRRAGISLFALGRHQWLGYTMTREISTPSAEAAPRLSCRRGIDSRAGTAGVEISADRDATIPPHPPQASTRSGMSTVDMATGVRDLDFQRWVCAEVWDSGRRCWAAVGDIDCRRGYRRGRDVSRQGSHDTTPCRLA